MSLKPVECQTNVEYRERAFPMKKVGLTGPYILAGTVSQKNDTCALGLIIAKCKTHGGVPHKVFSQLYDVMVQPIIDYGAAVWGVNEYSYIKTIQHRAGRYFLGLSVFGDVYLDSGDVCL